MVIFSPLSFLVKVMFLEFLTFKYKVIIVQIATIVDRATTIADIIDAVLCMTIYLKTKIDKVWTKQNYKFICK